MLQLGYRLVTAGGDRVTTGYKQATGLKQDCRAFLTAYSGRSAGPGRDRAGVNTGDKQTVTGSECGNGVVTARLGTGTTGR